MFCLLCIFFLIHLGSCSKKISWRSHKKRLYDDDFTTACDLCQNLDSLLIRYESYDYPDDQIQTSLLSSCNILSGKANEVCRYIADTYFPVFLHLAREGTAASVACTKMGYCSDLENNSN